MNIQTINARIHMLRMMINGGYGYFEYNHPTLYWSRRRWKRYHNQLTKLLNRKAKLVNRK